MTEQEQVEPRLLTPEYWDGHGFNDDCEWKDGTKNNGSNTLWADSEGRRILARFHEEQDNAVKLRKLAKGETFDAEDAHPEMTTILHFTRELYTPKPLLKGDPPYRSDDYWGVVMESPSRDRKKFIRRYFESLGVDFPGLPAGPVLQEGEVKHPRNVYRRGYKTETLFRDSGIEVFVIGGGARARVPERSPLPARGLVFRPTPA